MRFLNSGWTRECVGMAVQCCYCGSGQAVLTGLITYCYEIWMEVERSGQMKKDKEAKEEKSVYSADSYQAIFLTCLSTAIQRVYIVQDSRGISKGLASGNHSGTQNAHPSDSSSALPAGAFALYTPALVPAIDANPHI